MWTLKVEKYAKIDSAQITIAPFTMFIGDNNSGKSYIMTLIYGLLTTQFRNFIIDETSELYKECCESIPLEDEFNIRELLGKEFNELEFKKFVQLLNEVLELNKSLFLQQLFNKEIDIKKIEVDIPYIKGFSIEYIDVFNTNDMKAVFICAFNQQQKHIRRNGGKFIKKSKNIYCLEVIRYILHSILQYANGSFINAPAYFPTSRTGFMLTFK